MDLRFEDTDKGMSCRVCLKVNVDFVRYELWFEDQIRKRGGVGVLIDTDCV